MKRFAIYFFYDQVGIVDDYNIYMLEDLKKNIDHLMVVSNGPLNEEGYKKFTKVSDEIFERDNKGFDVWAYKEGIQKAGWNLLEQYDELILLNFTNFGPIYPFKDMFDEMDTYQVDFWGITEHYGHDFDPYNRCKYGYIPRHIQSSFIAIRNGMIKSRDFHDYWEKMPEIKDYADAICLHEAIFTEDFTRKGYTSRVYVQTQDLKDYSDYPLMLYPVELISNRKCPIFKRKTFFNLYEEFLDISCGQTGIELYEYLKDHTDYNLDMVWENILRTANMADIKDRMQLNYVLPVDFRKENLYPRKRIALFMHIYNIDLISYCRRYAEFMPKDADILITTDTKEKEKAILDEFQAYDASRIRTILIENRGRDVSALLTGLEPFYKDYDYICFAHDKKSGYDMPLMIGESFSYHCFENVLGSRDYIENIITTFDENPRLGMAVPPVPCHGTYFSVVGREWQGNYTNVKQYLKEWGIHANICDSKAPIAPLGTIFWFRSDALHLLFDKKFSYSDFPTEPISERDGNIMHSIERIYPLATQAAGYYSCWIMNSKYAKMEITNLYKMLRDANQTLFWNMGVDGRHQTLHKISLMKKDLESVTDNLEKAKEEIERLRHPKGAAMRIKLVCKCIIGDKAYMALWKLKNKSSNGLK